MVVNMQWFINISIAFDQFWNAVFGGDPDETVSSRLGKQARAGNWFARRACWLLSIIYRGPHCEEAIEEDEG